MNDVIIIHVPDVRIALAEAAGYLYPELPDHIVAVTGTSGKTSIVNYFMQICELLGHPAASIGSIGVKCTDKKLEAELVRDNELTTPDVISMRQILSKLKKGGITHVAFEASSHGLDQRRVYGIKVEAAAFTNISPHDHLDYHGTMEAYTAAKMLLFSENLKDGGRVVIGARIPSHSRFDSKETVAVLLSHEALESSIASPEGAINITETSQSISGQEIYFSHLGSSYVVSVHIIGSFQASNILMATSLADKVFGDFDKIVKVLPRVCSIGGRLERVTSPDDPFQVIVDYSYKPDALEKVLLELKAICKNRLFVVFGCGGDRNKEKRPLMGAIATKLADMVIITDDNLRSEDAAEIRRQIATGGPKAKIIGGREDAIGWAIAQLQKDDILLIAGKGHEDYQLIGDKKLPFDDRLIAKKFIEQKL